ncbi:hypothetical protein FBU30_008619 [Linnemannia zychae]|nr:hypothetical protein FBU30_008619 [Linnemannia zychae]
MSDSSTLVSINAADNASNPPSSFQDTPKPSVPNDNSIPANSVSSSSILAASATATHPMTIEPNEPVAKNEHKSEAGLPPKPPIILLPPVEIEDSKERSIMNSTKSNGTGISSKENIDPLATPSPSTAATTTTAKNAIKTTKPATGTTTKTTKPGMSTTAATTTRKPLTTSSLSRAATSTTTTAGSATKGKPSTATSSLTKTAVKTRPPIPSTLKSVTTKPTTSASSIRISATSSSSTTASTTTAASTRAAARTLAPATTTTTIRRSPSTPALPTRPVISSATRRVASSSDAVPTTSSSSSRSSPSSTPGPTRSTSRASIASSATTTTTASTARRPLTSSSTTTPANRATTTSRVSASGTNSTALTTRKPLTSTTNLSSTSSVRSTSTTSSLGKSSVRPTGTTQSTTPTPIRKTLTTSTASTSTRPVTDAAKVKMLSSQLSGLQEKHDQTLKLLQEQEERLKRELAELSAIPQDPQRKPIPSDTQDVLQEMEDLRIQFQTAKEQHEKALEDIATERALELSQLKESHETLLSAMTKERDTIAESLKTLRESGDASEKGKNERIKTLEEQLGIVLQEHADVVEDHKVAMETLRDEIEAAWSLKLESKIQALEKDHKDQLSAAEEKLKSTGHSGEEAIQQLKDSFAEKLKELEDEKESRILDLINQHEAELQAEKDLRVELADEYKDLIARMKDEHEEVVGRLKIRLESTEDALENAQTELGRVQAESQGELQEVRRAMEEIRQLLAIKEEEANTLGKRLQELTEGLQNASMDAMLKDNKKFKVKVVQIYGSSVSGNLKVKRAQHAIGDTLERMEIEHEFVDVSSSDEAKNYMRRKNGGETQLPQIFSGGEYRGVYDDFDYAIETHQLTQFLGFDRTKAFVPREKIPVNSTYNLAQDGEDAEQGAGLPDVVINGLNNRLTASSSSPTSSPPRNVRQSGDMATSLYLLSPSSNRFQSTSSLASNGSSRSNGFKRPGFVQTASQAWDGALKDDVTQAKHDLGFNSVVTPDDDELDELFEKGAVSEAEIEAMLASVHG